MSGANSGPNYAAVPAGTQYLRRCELLIGAAAQGGSQPAPAADGAPYISGSTLVLKEGSFPIVNGNVTMPSATYFGLPAADFDLFGSKGTALGGEGPNAGQPPDTVTIIGLTLKNQPAPPSAQLASSQGALDLSQLRIKFDITAAMGQTPKSLEARVYNLSDSTAQLIQKEFAPVRLSVGYGSGALALIFTGTAIYLRRGRESPLDTYLDIVAGDGDQGYILASVAKTLAAGHTAQDVVNVATTAMAPFGMQQGQIDGLPTTQAQRGRALYGPARSTLRDVTNSAGSDWFVENGSVHIIPKAAYRSDEVVQINSATGMIGMPQQTPDGIAVRVLLNPRIRPGCKIQINNGDIQRQKVGSNPADIIQSGFLPRVTADGFYKVLMVQHRGDTRGHDWFTDIVCVGINEEPTVSFVQKKVQPGG